MYEIEEWAGDNFLKYSITFLVFTDIDILFFPFKK